MNFQSFAYSQVPGIQLLFAISYLLFATGNNTRMNILERIRRNHGIEHATVHVLSEGNPNLSLVGRADSGGFNIIGNVNPVELAEAAQEALRRMKDGQGNLAVHPRCGTQLVTVGTLTACAAFLAIGRKPNMSRLPDVIIATTLAAIIAQPLGLQLQKYVTTSANVADAYFIGVTPRHFGAMDYWHVDIGWEPQTEPARYIPVGQPLA